MADIIDKPRRIGIGKALRFEVLKRDKFTCQYCGAAGHEVPLEIDHIRPVKDRGNNEFSNLITACRACNSGKGCRPLGDKVSIIDPSPSFDVTWDAIHAEVERFTHHHMGSRAALMFDEVIERYPLRGVLFAIRASFFENYYGWSNHEIALSSWNKTIDLIPSILNAMSLGCYPKAKVVAVLALDGLLVRFGRQHWGYTFEYTIKALEAGLDQAELMSWAHGEASSHRDFQQLLFGFVAGERGNADE